MSACYKTTINSNSAEGAEEWTLACFGDIFDMFLGSKYTDGASGETFKVFVVILTIIKNFSGIRLISIF